jgi:hypothetical protein
VNHKRINAAILCEFFGAEPGMKSIPNFQHFDLASLTGRLLSSSYVPEAGQPRYEEMLNALRGLYDAHQKEDRVTFEYDTLIYFGRLR